MALTGKQKKYLRKNLRTKSLREISNSLNISQAEIKTYLKKIWKKKKYQQFITRNQKNSKKNREKSIKDFDFKKWLNLNQGWLVILIFLAILIYLNSLGNEFVSDDVYYFIKDPEFGKLSYVVSSFPTILRPLIFTLIKNIFGLSAFLFRLVNLFFHIGSVVLTFLLVSLLIAPKIALWASLLLAVHPVEVEAVTWISGGGYSQYSFFILLGLLLYFLSQKQKKLYFFSLISFFLALLSSKKAIFFPFVLLTFVLSFGQIKKVWKKIVPPFILGFTWTLFYAFKISERITNLEAGSAQKIKGFNPLLQIPIAIGSYFKLLFYPKNLTLYHSEMFFTQGEYWFYLLITLVFLGLIIFFFKKNKTVFFFLSLFLISLLPFLTPFGISWIVAERYLYLGSIGIFTVLAMLMEKLIKKGINKKIIYFLFTLIIFLLSLRTVQRNFDWKNQDSLWLAAAKTSPNSAQNNNNLGDLYARRGDFQKAIAHFQKAIKLKSGYADAHHNLANVHQKTGELELAIENYKKAVENNPSLWQSHQGLATIYLDQDKKQEATKELEILLQFYPNNEEIKKLLLQLKVE